MVHRAFLLVLILSAAVLAQQPGPDASGVPSRAINGPESSQWRSLSAEEKLRYDARHLVELDNLVYAGIGAAFDQARNRPPEWGQGWGAFSERYASHVGQYLVQRSIMFPAQAMDGEGTRFFHSKRTSYHGRIADAFLHTIWRHEDSGGMMPSYSEFLGDYGAAAVSRMWWPQRFHNRRAIFFAGSDTILIDAGINVMHEFAPDMKRWLHGDFGRHRQ